MQRRGTVLRILGFVFALALMEQRAGADVMTLTQEKGLGTVKDGVFIPDPSPIIVGGMPLTPFTPTDWGPANTSSNPLTFFQFSPGRTISDAIVNGNPQSVTIPVEAQLQQVNITFNWGFSNQISLTFGPSGNESVSATGGITLAKPNADIQGPNPDPNNFLFPTQTFSRVFAVSDGEAGKTYFSPSAPGNPNAPGLPQTFISGQNGYASPLSVSYNALTDPADVKAFLGTGTVGFQVIATAAADFFSSNGNGDGTSLTSAYPDMTVTYVYTTIPEPSSFLLVGLGGGLVLVYRHRRRKPAA
jgi:hypothetical protein